MTAIDPPVDPSLPLPAQRVLLIGFGEFERHALSSYLRLSGTRVPAYEQVHELASADFIIADVDHPGAIDQVIAAERSADTVYIGSLAPEGALGWAMRPIDPLSVFRELDAAVALRHFKNAPPPPLNVASAPAPLTDEQQPQRRATDVATAPLALLVDDSEIALRFLERQLQALGLRTETARDSQSALERIAQQRYDAVFIDLDLGPDSTLDGFALCQHLKKQQRPHGSGVPPRIVIASAHAGPTDRVRGAFAGCDAYLAKPIKEDTLLQHLLLLGLVAPPEADKPRRRHKKASSASSAAGAQPDVDLDLSEPVAAASSAAEAPAAPSAEPATGSAAEPSALFSPAADVTAGADADANEAADGSADFRVPAYMV